MRLATPKYPFSSVTYSTHVMPYASLHTLSIWGPLTYDIELEDGRIVTRHIDNLRKQLIPSMHFYVQSDLTTPH